MKIRPQTAILLSILFVIAGILATWATGLWATESNKVPRTIATEDSKTQYDPADIRGSYTFSEISRLYAIPLADLAAAFTLTEEKAEGFQVKSLEGLFSDSGAEVGTASVRLFVAWYLGLAHTPTEENYLPEPAASILTDQGHMTPEQAAFVVSHTVLVQAP